MRYIFLYLFVVAAGLFTWQPEQALTESVNDNEHYLLPSYNLSLSCQPTSLRWLPPASHANKLNAKPCNYTLPIVKLYINEDAFFHPVSGIYTFGLLPSDTSSGTVRYDWFNIPFNFTKRGKEWRRNARVELIDTTGLFLYKGECKIGIHGNATRAYPQKSLRLVFSKKNAPITTALFDGHSNHNIKSLLLRNSGNDWGKTLIADAMQMELFSFAGLDAPDYKYCVVYVNEEYWGIHQYATHISENYLARKYDVKKSDITLLEGNMLSYGKTEELRGFNELIRKCKSNPAEGYKTLEKEIDLDNFLTYIAVMLYAANSDWPHSNIKCYKVSGGKWKWILHDLDCAFGFSGAQWNSYNVFTFLRNDNSYAGVFYRTCMNNREWKKKLLSTLQEMLRTHVSFTQTQNVIKKHTSIIQSEMPAHIDRWRFPADMGTWKANIENLIVFAKNRPGIVLKQISSEFK